MTYSAKRFRLQDPQCYWTPLRSKSLDTAQDLQYEEKLISKVVSSDIITNSYAGTSTTAENIWIRTFLQSMHLSTPLPLHPQRPSTNIS